jgi:ketosteroid isomerase-like protein
MSINPRMASAHISVVVALAVALAGCAAPPPPESQARDIVLDEFPEEQAEIRDALFALAEAARVHNTEGQRLAHLNTSKFTAFGSDKPSVKDFAEKVEEEVAFFSSLDGLTIDWEDDLRIDVFGDVAVVTCLLSFSGTGSDGKQVEVEGKRATLVLVRTPDGWKIVHEHVS